MQASPAQIQQKVLQKILGKVFITMNCTQHKTLHALKVDLLEMSDNKNIWKLLSKYELFSLDQANTTKAHPYSFPTPLAISIKFPLGQLKPLFNVIFIKLHHVLYGLPYFFLPHSNTWHNYWICQTISQAKPIKFNIKIYTNHNTLLVNHTTYKKTETLRADSLSRSDNMVHNKLSWILFKMVGALSFSQPYLCLWPTPTIIRSPILNYFSPP